MKSEQDFNKFYNSDLTPEITRRYGKIHAAALKSGFLCVIMAALALAIIKYGLVPFINLPAAFIYTPCMLLAAAMIAVKFRSDLKEIQIPLNEWLWASLVRYAAGDTKTEEILKRGQRISDASLTRSRIFDYSKFKKSGGNFTSFYYQNTNGMTISDFALFTWVKKRRKSERKYFFKGVFFSLDFQKDIKDDIYLIPKNRTGRNIDVEGKEVHLENIELSQRYKIFCRDEIEVRKIFSLGLMENIIEINEIFPRTKYFAFRHGRRLTIFIENESIGKIIDRRLPPIFKSDKKIQNHVKNMLKEIERYIRLYEILEVEKNRSERILNEIMKKNIKRQLDLSETPSGKFNEGNAASQAGDHETAFIFWASAAQAGHVGALNNLAGAYLRGNGCMEDKEKAFDLYSDAADKGNENSIYNMGYCREYGYGCTQDKEKAFEYYKQAAHLGHAGAMYKVGCFYKNGIAGEKNEPEALNWLKSASNKGEPRAAKLLEEIKPS